MIDELRGCHRAAIGYVRLEHEGNDRRGRRERNSKDHVFLGVCPPEGNSVIGCRRHRPGDLAGRPGKRLGRGGQRTAATIATETGWPRVLCARNDAGGTDTEILDTNWRDRLDFG